MSHNNRHPTRPSFGPGKPRNSPIVLKAVEELHGATWFRVPVLCGSCPETFRCDECKSTPCAVNRELNMARRRAMEW